MFAEESVEIPSSISTKIMPWWELEENTTKKLSLNYSSYSLIVKENTR